MNLTESRPKIIIAIVVGIVLILGLGILALTSLRRQSQTVQTFSPQQQKASDKIIPPTTGRSPLPKTAADIKTEIINSSTVSQGTDKILYDSQNFRIIYSPSLDLFITQIFKDPAGAYSQAAQKWFLDKGLSQQELCTLPLRLALFNPELKQTNPNFSLLPQDC